ncbi:MAG TPA: TlpA disulfide reductase family protein [Mucilaginibacter sp.]
MKKYLINIFLFCLLITSNTVNAQKHPDNIIITGNLLNRTEADSTVYLLFNPNLLSGNELLPTTKELICKSKNGRFRFVIPGLYKAVYITIGSRKRKEGILNYGQGIEQGMFLDNFFACPGDNIFMNVDIVNGCIDFKGTGASKYSFAFNSNKIKKQASDIFRYYEGLQLNEKLKIAALTDGQQFQSIALSNMVADSLYHLQLHLLSAIESKLRRNEFRWLRTDLLYSWYYEKLSNFYRPFAQEINNLTPSNCGSEPNKTIISYYNTHFIDQPKLLFQYTNSRELVKYLILKSIVDSKLKNNPYEILKNKYTGALRDQLVATYLIEDYGGQYGNLQKELCIKDALSIVKSPPLLNLLKSTYDTNREGVTAYDFSLNDMNGKTMRLSDFKGKLVFIDFWFTGCGGCIDFYQNVLSKLEEHYKNDPRVVFVTISPDKDSALWLNSVAKDIYTSPSLPNVINLHSLVGLLDPVFREYNITSMPRQMLIGGNGEIYSADNLRKSSDELVRIIDVALRKRNDILN